MDIFKARRRSFDVEYVIVTETNLEEVADWCGGKIGGAGDRRYVEITDKNAISARQSKSFIGDYVLKSGTGFKSYGKKSFKKSFEDMTHGAATAEAAELLATLPESDQDFVLGRKQEHDRSAVTGQYLSHDEAEANPDTTVHETD